MQGLFDTWRSKAGEQAPDNLCDGYEHRLSKKFASVEKARAYYQECLTSGVLDILQPEPTPDEVLFVIRGAQPGVYTKR